MLVSAFRHADPLADGFSELIQHFDSTMTGCVFSAFNLRLFADRALRFFRAIKKRQTKKGRAEAKRRFTSKGAHGHISRALERLLPCPP